MKVHERIQQILAQEAQSDCHCLSRACGWVSRPWSWSELAEQLVFALPPPPPSASLQPPEVGATGAQSPFCTLDLPR